MQWEGLSEQQRAACQTLAEIVGDNGAPFTIEALANAVENEARTTTGNYGDNLAHAVTILRQLAEVLESSKA